MIPYTNRFSWNSPLCVSIIRYCLESSETSIWLNTFANTNFENVALPVKFARILSMLMFGGDTVFN